MKILEGFKPLATKKLNDVRVSIIAIFRDGYLTALPNFPLQMEHGASIYIIAKREGQTFSSKPSEFPGGGMSWQDDRGHKAPTAPGYLIIGEDPHYLYARYTWQNLVIPSSSQLLTVNYNLDLPQKRYSFVFKDIKLPQEKRVNGVSKYIVPAFKKGEKLKIEGKEYVILASQVQKDIRVSIFRMSRSSSILSTLPGRKGVEIGILIEGFGKPLQKDIRPVSALSLKDEKGKIYSSWERETCREQKLVDLRKSTLGEISPLWGCMDVYFLPGLKFPQSPKYLTLQYYIFIFPDEKYSLVFKNVRLP